MLLGDDERLGAPASPGRCPLLREATGREPEHVAYWDAVMALPRSATWRSAYRRWLTTTAAVSTPVSLPYAASRS